MDTGYPVILTDMEGISAVVVGGGPVGERKVKGLLAVGASVRLVSPEATRQLQAMAAEGHIAWEQRPYEAGDLHGAQLAFAATDHRTVNAQVASDAAMLGLLCNVADAPDEGSFHLPAVHREAGLVIAVSTGGESPTRARQVRDRIAAWLAEEA